MTPLLQVSVLLNLLVSSTAWHLWTVQQVAPVHGIARLARCPTTICRSSTTNDEETLSLSMSLSRRSMVKVTSQSILLGGVLLLGNPSAATAAYIDPATNALTITDKVYLDVEWINSSSIKTQGRITIGLYGQVMPKTVENFATLCRQNAYAGTTFYRVISDFSIQAGAIGDTTESGKVGRSALTTYCNHGTRQLCSGIWKVSSSISTSSWVGCSSRMDS